jgi:cbb3-type cytochrome oxidase subunit 1
MLLVLAGMIWGLQMAITDDHSAFPAHAHLNLLGFVALFLFGIFYRLNPTVESSRLAIPQVLIWIVSTVVLAIGVGLVHTAIRPATRSPQSGRLPYSQTR